MREPPTIVVGESGRPHEKITPEKIWFFSKGNEAVRLETRFDNPSREYVLEITWADRPTTIERFQSLAQFKARVLVVEDQLSAEHWTQVG